MAAVVFEETISPKKFKCFECFEILPFYSHEAVFDDTRINPFCVAEEVSNHLLNALVDICRQARAELLNTMSK